LTEKGIKKAIARIVSTLYYEGHRDFLGFQTAEVASAIAITLRVAADRPCPPFPPLGGCN
jgi:hypothetical protein